MLKIFNLRQENIEENLGQQDLIIYIEKQTIYKLGTISVSQVDWFKRNPVMEDLSA